MNAYQQLKVMRPNSVSYVKTYKLQKNVRISNVRISNDIQRLMTQVVTLTSLVESKNIYKTILNHVTIISTEVFLFIFFLM